MLPSPCVNSLHVVPNTCIIIEIKEDVCILKYVKDWDNEILLSEQMTPAPRWYL